MKSKKSKIRALFPSKHDESTGIATVIEVKGGRAATVNLDGTLCPVDGHLSQVEPLEIGDRVLIVPTEEGAIVAGRLRAEGEAHAPRLEVQDGHLLVEATRSIRLQVGQNRIEVHPDGVRLQGPAIEFDGP
jgi:hypothetical protein